MFSWIGKRNYFKSVETTCDCGCGMDITEEFRSKINDLRHALNQPMIVNSGARCQSHNTSVNGSSRSAHMLGRAVDIRITSPTFERDLITLAKAHGLRIGRYRTFVHIDDLLGPRNHFDMRK